MLKTDHSTRMTRRKSSTPSPGGATKKKNKKSRDGVYVAKTTVTTDVTNVKQVTTTTSLNRYTFTKLPGQSNDVTKDHPPKVRTLSCSSIPYDNIIENLAPFRKRFCNVQLFPGEERIPSPPPTTRKMSINRAEVEGIVDGVINMAVELIQRNNLLGVVRGVIPSASNPSAENVLDARNFVEEYEEYHDSCSELPDSTPNVAEVVAADSGPGSSSGVVEKPKKFVKHGGVTCLIAVETDSNAEDEPEPVQNDMRLLEVGARYNIPKNLFLTKTEMMEITEQTIDALHSRNEENAGENPDLVEQPVVVNLTLKEGKVEDDDDVYRPIAVSPDGRFFKYEEEVSLTYFLWASSS